jgi:hypothetical protein
MASSGTAASSVSIRGRGGGVHHLEIIQETCIRVAKCDLPLCI